MSTAQEVLLPIHEIERRTGLCRSYVYEKIRDGTFPRPVKVGKRAVRWRERDITAWIQSLPDADGDAAK